MLRSQTVAVTVELLHCRHVVEDPYQQDLTPLLHRLLRFGRSMVIIMVIVVIQDHLPHHPKRAINLIRPTCLPNTIITTTTLLRPSPPLGLIMMLYQSILLLLHLLPAHQQEDKGMGLQPDKEIHQIGLLDVPAGDFYRLFCMEIKKVPMLICQ